MAGIGFELQKLAKEDGIISHLGAMSHAAVIAAGPWMFTIIAISLITLVTESSLGLDALAEFRVLVIYAFALSLVMTAPVVIVATRMVSEVIYDKKFNLVSHIFFAALTFGAIVTAVSTLVIDAGLFALELIQLITATTASIIVGLIWVALAFCNAVRDYRGITIGFLAGLLIAVLGGAIATAMGYGAMGLVWTFNLGFSFTLFWLISRVLLTFPDNISKPFTALRIFLYAGRRYWLLALAATLSAIAIWIDKWIMWLGPAGETLPNGFIHAPLYDSAMFIAYLSIIPSLSFFILNLETDFFTRYQRYYADIKAHATLRQIKENADKLSKHTFDSLVHIMMIQASLCAIMVLVSPQLIELFNMQFRQVGILRLGIIGALFHFLFLACSSLLLFFNRNMTFLKLQLLFLALNAGLTYGAMVMGEDYYGFGYLLACLTSSLLSLLALEKAFTDLNYFTFVMAAMGNDKGNWLRQWESI